MTLASKKIASENNSRELQKQATRSRILSSAVSSLIDLGVARTTTLEVQRRAEVSRGALLYHFPTHADLISAVIAEIVVRNEQKIAKIHARKNRSTDPIEAAIDTFSYTISEASFVAELELWVVSRTNNELHEALIAAEKNAFENRVRVIDLIFEPLRDYPAHDVMVEMTIEFMRGLAVSGILRRNPKSTAALLKKWTWVLRQLIGLEPEPS